MANDFQIQIGASTSKASHDIKKFTTALEKQHIDLTASVDLAKTKVDAEKQMKQLAQTLKATLAKENISITDKQALSIIKQQTKEEEKLANAIDKAKTKAAESLKIQKEKLALSQNKAINKNLDDEYKARVKLADATKNQASQIKSVLSSGGVDASISRTTTQYSKLSNVTTELQSDFKQLKVYQDMLSTSTSDKELISNYDKFNSTLVKVNNQMKILSNEQGLAKSNTKLSDSFELTKVKADSAQKSFSAYVKTLNLSEVKKQSDVIKTISDSFEKVKQTGDSVDFRKATASVSNFKANMKDAGAEAKSFGSQLTDNISKFSQWFIIGGSVASVVRGFKEGVEFVKDLSDALTNINYTMSLTSDELDEIGKASIDMAKDLNTSAKNVLEAVKLYANANETAQSILNKAQPAIMLSNVTGMSGTESAEMLQTIMNQFDLTQNDLMAISDTIQGISQNLAHDFADGIKQINSGISESGTVAKMAGLSLGEYASIIGVILEKSGEDGSKIGNSLKTIISRVTSASKGMGTLETDISNAETAFKAVGIAIRSDDGTFRDFADIMSDLSDKWKVMNDVQKSNISFYAAGTRQINILKTLANSWDEIEEVTKKANESSGVTLENQNTYASSLQGKLGELNSVWESIWSNTINSSGLKFIVDLGIGVSDLVDKTGLLQVAFTELAIIGAVKLLPMITSYISGIGTLIAQEVTMTGATGALATAQSALNVVMAMNPIGALVIGLTALIGVVKGAAWIYDELNTSLEEHAELVNEANSDYENAKSELDSINKELKTQSDLMDELLDKDNLTFAEKGQLEELQNITKELQVQADLAEKEVANAQKKLALESASMVSDGYDVGNVSSDKINEYESNADITGNNAALISDENDIAGMIAGYKQFIELKDKALRGSDDYEHFSSLTDEISDSIWKSASALQEQKANMESYYTTIKDIPYDQMSTDEKKVYDAYTQTAEAIELIYKELDPNKWKEMSFNEIFNADSFSKTKAELENLAKAGNLSPETISSNERYKKILSDTGLTAKEVAEQINALVEEEKKTGEVELTKLSFSDTIKQLDAMTESFGKLDSAYSSISDGGVSYSDISSLMAQFSDVSGIENYIKAIQDAKGNTEATKEAFNNLASAYIESTGILNNVTDENASHIASMLEEQGVANANEIVTNQLAAAKEYASLASQDLENGILSEVNSLALEDGVIDATEQSLIAYTIGKQTANLTTLSTVSDIDSLIAIVDALGYATDALEIYKSVKAGAGLGSGGYTPVGFEADDTSALDEIKNALNGANTIDYTGGSSSKKASSSGKSDADAYLEAYKKELAQLEHDREMGQISDKNYYSQLSELNESYFNNTAANHEKYLDEYQANEEKIFSGMQSYYKEYYEDQLSALSTFRGDELKSYQERSVDILNEINNLNAQAQISAETYSDLLTSYFENQKTQYQAAAQYAQKVIQKQISSIQAKSDAFKNAKEDEIEDIEDEIDALNDQKDSIENYYNDQIDSIQKVIDARQAEIDAINEKTEAEKLQYDLEQKQYLLEQARNQRTISQFNGKEFTYTADTDSIRSAQEGVNEAQSNITVNNLSKQIDSLEAQQDTLNAKMKEATIAIENQITALQDKKSAIQDLIDETTEKYQEQIDSLQAYSDQWAAVTEAQTTAEEEKIAMEILGATSENDILNNREAILALFGENYKTITDNLATVAQANADQMSSIASQMAEAAQKAMEAAKKMAEAKAKMGSSKYASGTKNAKEGLNEVAEGGKPEIVKFNDGTYSLYKEPSLVPMEGGETVYNGNETAKLLRQRSADLVAMIKSGTVGNFSAQNSIASNLQSSIPSTSSFKTNTTNNTSAPVIMNNNFPNVTKESDANAVLLHISKQLNQRSKINF